MILTLTMNPALDKVYAIDDFKVNKVFRPQAMTATAGGKGLNVARVASILGEKVIASGLIGGSTGIFIEEEIKKQGIDSQFLKIEGETRICINIMDKKNTTSTEVLEPGPIVSEKKYKLFLKHYRQILDSVEIIVASGSLPQGLPSDYYNSLAIIAKELNKKFLLDTSGIYLKEGIKEAPFMIKPNQDEIKMILGENLNTQKDYVKAIEIFKDKGISIPVISLGKDGCLVGLEDGVYKFTTPKIEVVNTVGSGDSFMAGCAVALSQGKNLIEIIKLGMACGTANTQFFQTGKVTTEKVAKFLKEITYHKI